MKIHRIIAILNWDEKPVSSTNIAYIKVKMAEKFYMKMEIPLPPGTDGMVSFASIPFNKERAAEVGQGAWEYLTSKFGGKTPRITVIEEVCTFGRSFGDAHNG